MNMYIIRYYTNKQISALRSKLFAKFSSWCWVQIWYKEQTKKTQYIRLYLFRIYMFFKKKSFKNKTIWELNNYNSYKPFSGTAGVAKFLIILSCIFLIFFVGKYVIKWAQLASNYISKWAIQVISSTVGDDMIKDEFGNINLMIIGYGGESHAGWYLADSIMVASFNPKLWAVTMLSVPRDLYVYNEKYNTIGRINALFSHTVGRKREFSTWAKVLSDKLEEIMGLTIPYYAMIDFAGFEKVIDTLGGIHVDVPSTLHDVAFPNEKGWYMTIHIDSWVNLMDGKTALQYARSRHSTSDFSRSLRQQLILQWIIDKLKENGVSNVSKIQDLYEDYIDMVNTNITVKEIIGIARYAVKIKHMFSFWYTIECSHAAHRFSSPACFLYTPNRELFGWAAAIIPFWSTAAQVWFYDYTKQFAFFVAHNQEYLIENQNIYILNGIEKTYAKTVLKKSDWFATQLAVKLKKYAFNIHHVENFATTLTGTTVYVLWTGEYKHTVKTLKNFILIDEVITAPDPVLIQQYTGADMLLVLGNSYVDQLALQPFNYFK